MHLGLLGRGIVDGQAAKGIGAAYSLLEVGTSHDDDSEAAKEAMEEGVSIFVEADDGYYVACKPITFSSFVYIH